MTERIRRRSLHAKQHHYVLSYRVLRTTIAALDRIAERLNVTRSALLDSIIESYIAADAQQEQEKTGNA